MEVITENPIVYIGADDTYDADIFLYANGTTDAPKSTDPKIKDLGNVVVKGKKPTPSQVEDAKKKGFTWDSVNNVFKKADELGIVDAILGKLGINPKSNTPPVGVDPIMETPTAESKGMSTMTKVLIGVGVVAVVGFILYSSKKK